MKIAIAGAGMTGAYLYRLLDKERHTVQVFDGAPKTRCGLTPCAWGTSRGFADLVAAAGLDPHAYVLKKTDHVIIDGLRIPADLMTIDKPRLVGDLLEGAAIAHEELDAACYDRIIDATGAARSFLPPVQDDVILECAQWRIETETRLENRIQLGEIGYAWSFPLFPKEYHVGCGSLAGEPRTIMEEIGWIDRERQNIRCACAGAIRLAAPRHARPFVAVHGTTEIWGIGEAIGCVAPLAGDGIVPGMRSVQILMQWWDDSSGYTEAILREFAWMEDERRVIDKLRSGKRLTLRDARVLNRNAKRMGMKVRIKEAAALLERLR